MPLLENPISAQRNLLAGKALVNQPDLAVIQVGGDDRKAWLHSLISQNINGLQAGQSTEALVLDANGRLESILRVFEDGTSTWIITERGGFDQLLLWLRKMVFRSKVSVAAREDLALVASWGSSVESPTPLFAWTDNWLSPAPGGHRYGQAPSEPWGLVLNVLTTGEAAGLLANANVDWAPEAALDALRIAAHRPSVAELDEKSIPHELDLLASAVHLTKGCYRGQETVAKVHNLGHPPRRLVLLHLDGSGHLLPEIGDEVVIPATDGEAKVVGRVTSAATHHEAGPMALAVISRTTDVAAELAVIGAHESISATQEVIVPTDAGKVANLPRPGMLGRPRR